LKKCPFCAEEIQDAAVVCTHCGRTQAAPDPTPVAKVLLGLTMWLAWTVRPMVNPEQRLAGTPQETGPIASVSYKLMGIASRLGPEGGRTASSGHVHQLIRFNVCNFGPQSVTLRAVAVNTTGGDTLSCDWSRRQLSSRERVTHYASLSLSARWCRNAPIMKRRTLPGVDSGSPPASCRIRRRSGCAASLTHRFARHAQARLQLRAHRHPFDPTPERLDENKVALVSPIEAYGLAEETRRDTEAKRGVSAGAHAAVSFTPAGRLPSSCIARFAMPSSVPSKTSLWSG
jgi:hypothetical protein